MSETTENSSPRRPASNRTNLVLPVVGLLLLIGALYWGFMQPGSEPVPEPPAAQAVTPEVVEVTPIVPADLEPAAPAEPIIEDQPEPMADLTPPPAAEISLADSDALLAGAIEELELGPMGTTFIQQANSLERGVAIVDNLRMGEVPYKLLPIGRPTAKFPFTDDGLGVTLNPEGFNRYNGLASAIGRLDIDSIMSVYRQFQAPINEAWALLGYSDTTFEATLQEALEIIMLAPETDLTARLIKKEANWIYEDDTLESLPALQKQLMRMGPDNAETIKDKARELRGALLDAQP